MEEYKEISWFSALRKIEFAFQFLALILSEKKAAQGLLIN
jgi:hypothetical protein